MPKRLLKLSSLWTHLYFCLGFRQNGTHSHFQRLFQSQALPLVLIQTHTHRPWRVHGFVWSCKLWQTREHVKPWSIFLRWNFAHIFSLNQKELVKQKHSLNYSVSFAATVGTDFLFLHRPSPSLWTWPWLSPHKQWQSQVPSWQLEENFALTYKTVSGNRFLGGEVLIAVCNDTI